MRGKRFRDAHFNSILKKRLAKEALLKRAYLDVWSEISMEVVDKTISMSNFGSSSNELSLVTQQPLYSLNQLNSSCSYLVNKLP